MNLRKDMRKIQEDFNDAATLALCNSIKQKTPKVIMASTPQQAAPNKTGRETHQSLAQQQASWLLKTNPKGITNRGKVNPSTAPLYKMGDPLEKKKPVRANQLKTIRQETLVPE